MNVAYWMLPCSLHVKHFQPDPDWNKSKSHVLLDYHSLSIVIHFINIIEDNELAHIIYHCNSFNRSPGKTGLKICFLFFIILQCLQPVHVNVLDVLATRLRFFRTSPVHLYHSPPFPSLCVSVSASPPSDWLDLLFFLNVPRADWLQRHLRHAAKRGFYWRFLPVSDTCRASS